MAELRRVLVTGCSSGFGRSLVPSFLERGWEVIATLRRAEERSELTDSFQEEASRLGATDRLIVQSLDVTSASERTAVARLVVERGPLHCLVNNAGFGLLGALEDLSEEQLRHQFEVNVFNQA